MRRDAAMAQRSPGYETEISIVDIDFDPSVPQTETLSLDLTCTNRRHGGARHPHAAPADELAPVPAGPCRALAVDFASGAEPLVAGAKRAARFEGNLAPVRPVWVGRGRAPDRRAGGPGLQASHALDAWRAFRNLRARHRDPPDRQ
ncbi:hypothetical protein G6F31_018355 [Rhizopus arrhizus]|nr:hypothetical protein G6F31_018355 [Rhizopus arrhizus]